MFQSNYTVYFFSSARGVQRIFPDCSGEVYRGVIPNMMQSGPMGQRSWKVVESHFGLYCYGRSNPQTPY